jgi:hypothetical protein
MRFAIITGWLCLCLVVACSSGASQSDDAGVDAMASGGGGVTVGQGGGTTPGQGGATVSGQGGTGSGGKAIMGGSGGVVGGIGGSTPAAGGSTPATGGAPGTGGSAAEPPVGNPLGKCAVPPEAMAESIANPRTVVGDGTPQTCTSDAFVAAVAKGGVITFSCGANPKTIILDRTAKVVNDTGPKIVIDGGGKVTLSGGGKVRILYQNTCDEAQKYTTSHCQDQDSPQLTLQNLTFVDGNSKGQNTKGEGGGAVFVSGGRLKIVNTRFFRNVCDDVGPDLGGAAMRAVSLSQGSPAYVVGSTFGGQKGFGNSCSNGAGISGLGVSVTVINSLISHNQAVGTGANPAKAGTPGGGSGGAIYTDGFTFTLALCGVAIHDNTANEGGGAIFYVSNNNTGSLIIKDSVLTANVSKGFETQGYPGIFVKAKGNPEVSGSTITK